MFITKRHHNETLAAAHDETRVLERRLRAAESIIASKEASIKALEKLVRERNAQIDSAHEMLRAAQSGNAVLRGKLAPFERVRGKGGRFVSMRATEYDPVRAAFEGSVVRP